MASAAEWEEATAEDEKGELWMPRSDERRGWNEPRWRRCAGKEG